MNKETYRFHVTSAGVGELLRGGGEFLTPRELLGDLTEAQALAVPPGALYSIGGLVAHMHYWQERNIAGAMGEKPPRPLHLDDTFPALTTGEWEDLRSAFLKGLETCAQAAIEKGEMTSPDRNDTSVGYDLAECPAMHNAYHYGQIAMLRQFQGFWPPPGGDGGW